MKNKELINSILATIKLISDDKEKLEKVWEFMQNEFKYEPAEIEVPEKYKKAVSEIAELIDCGSVCYFNPDTLEIEETFPGYMDEFILEEDAFYELKHHDWEKCIKFEPLESFDSFKIMENFIDTLDDTQLQNKLVNALNRRKPFANFKNIIDYSDYRQSWFEFKQKQIMEHVKEILMLKL